MAVVSWGLHWNGATGAVNGISFEKGKRNYAAVYRVTTDDPLDQVDTIVNYFQTHPTLPKLGSEYRYGKEVNYDLILTSIAPTPVENSRIHWEVTLGYAPKSDPSGEGTKEPETHPDKDTGEHTDDPRQWEDEYEIGSTQLSEPCWTAMYLSGFKGNAAIRTPPGSIIVPQNSAGIPFNPPLERQRSVTTLTVTKNKNQYDGILYASLHEAVNNDVITRAGNRYALNILWLPQTTMVRQIGGSYNLQNGIVFWRIRALLMYDPRGWDHYVADLGLTEAVPKEKLDPLDNQPPPGFDMTHPLDLDGTPLVEPFLLDGDGRRIDHPTPDRTNWLRYRVYLNSQPLMPLVF